MPNDSTILPIYDIAAVEYDPLGESMCLNIQIQDLGTHPGFNPIKAIRFATTEFLQTEAGKKVLHENNGCFNYGDFVQNVPDAITRHHGFTVTSATLADYVVDHNTSLISDDE